MNSTSKPSSRSVHLPATPARGEGEPGGGTVCRRAKERLFGPEGGGPFPPALSGFCEENGIPRFFERVEARYRVCCGGMGGERRGV